ncbi:trypsin-like peptidase domain-containing protein [Amycolatopsis nigrescens]|uniref:trypsin-like peptidase domain-containing protein n=1 Tax=Amycolatopsis nigrescens TaxID=381445 RepID=UPI000475BEEE|nr:trypsin-like peptidase domain-containing protein [Amycolatopsis nigrescens]
MTENDPSAQQDPGASERPAQQEPSTPPRGTPAGSEYSEYQAGAPSPWAAPSAPSAQSAPGQQGTGQEGVLFGSATQQAHQAQPGQAHPGQQNPYGQYGLPQSTATFAAPVTQQQRPTSRGSGRLVAGVAVLALLVGGAAGGIGGYLASDGVSGGSSVTALDQQPPARQTANAQPGSVEAVAEKLSPSVVQLRVAGRSGAGEGSGFVLSEDGYILTNNHVVEAAADGGQIQAVFQNGKKATAKIIGRDPTTDIAVVKADSVSGLTPVELGRSDDLKVGQGVVAIGSPFELAGTVTSGIVSSLHRPVSAGGGESAQSTVMDAVQTDAAINPGNSGGPLANTAGQVIGINSAIYSPQQGGSGGMPGQQSEGGNVGIGFAIPIDQARRTADDIIKNGKATQTFIGAGVLDAPEGGAQLGQITPGSPAEAAGLKPGDVVTKIDDRVVDDANTLVAAIRTRAPGEKVKLTVGDSQVVEVSLGGQPVTIN